MAKEKHDDDNPAGMRALPPPLVKSIRITPKVSLSFTGGKSGKKFNLAGGVPVDVDPADIKHIDPADYDLGDVAKADPPKKK